MAETERKWCRVCAAEVAALRFGDGKWRCCQCGASDPLEEL
jgi:ribosomal protein L37AE/L43A